MALNLCKATESHWKRNCASLSSVETEVILWPRSFKELHSRFADWAQSFQSNRLEHVRPWQCGVSAVFVWLRIAIIDYYYYYHRHHHHYFYYYSVTSAKKVICSDVVWDRRSKDKTGLRPKKSVLVLVLHAVVSVLVLQVWCCVVRETRSFMHAWRHNDLEGRSNFSRTIYCFSYSVHGTSLLWRSTLHGAHLLNVP